MTPLSAGLAAVIAVAATLLLLDQPAESHRSAPTAITADPLQIRSELASLRRDLNSIADAVPQRGRNAPEGVDAARILTRLAELEGRLDQLADSPARTTSRSATPAEVTSTDPDAYEDLRRRQEARSAALQQALESRFYEEPLDPQWARQTEASISRSLQEESFAGNQIGDLECQASLCRLQVHSADRQAQERFVAHYGNSPAFANTQAFWRRDDRPDGSSVTTLYVMREGLALPDADRVTPAG
jgi:hypothetical protein